MPLARSSHDVIPAPIRIGFTFACDAHPTGGEIHSIDGEGMTGMAGNFTATVASGL
jgi:hypothetical protein